MTEQLRLTVMAVPFTGHRPGGPRGLDADGEYFSDRTETMLDVVQRVPLFWHHGRDSTVGKSRIGYAEAFRKTAEGWVCDAVVTDPRLVPVLDRLAQRGELFASSGAVSHLVERRGSLLTLWPVGELSLTPNPSNRHAVARPSHDAERRRVLLLADAVLLRSRAETLLAA